MSKSKSFSGIKALFENVRDMYNPQIRLNLPEGLLTLKRVHEKIYVISKPDGGYSSKVSTSLESLEGFEVNKSKTKHPDWAVEALDLLEDSPRKMALLQGKRTNCCIFCARELTDPVSVYFGYGPICAEKWGLRHIMNEDVIREINILRFKMLSEELRIYNEANSDN